MKKIILLLILAASIFSCTKDDENEKQTKQKEVKETFTSLESPYLICAGRNPGGVAFDFIYKGNKGGSNNVDDIKMKELNPDMVVKTVKGQKSETNKSLGGMPSIRLSSKAKGLNYSAQDSKFIGYKSYLKIIKISDIKLDETKFKSDDSSFDLTKLKKGSSGKSLISDIAKEYKKLVIGNKWLKSAHNTIEGDEPIWIIKTSEGKYVKMIVKRFPAIINGKATNGYISLEWSILEE